MALTKEVRDFFTQRINRTIQTKIDKLNEPINQKALQAEALEQCEKVYKVSGITARAETLQKELKALQEQIEKVEKQIRSVETKTNWYGYSTDKMQSIANMEFLPAIKKGKYPEIVKETARLERLKEDVQSAVLLTTTEGKLVANLTALLNNYGGEIDDILEVLPK